MTERAALRNATIRSVDMPKRGHVTIETVTGLEKDPHLHGVAEVARKYVVKGNKGVKARQGDDPHKPLKIKFW
jgi:hypothetical protein